MFVEYRNLVLVKKTLFSEERVNLILFSKQITIDVFLDKQRKMYMGR